MDLTHLIYASSATHLMSDHDLLSLLAQAHKNNRRLSITGMLLYRGGNFLQVLEGDRPVVDSLFKIIVKDPRHFQVTLLLERAVSKPEFEDWEMGFVNLDQLDLAAIPGYSPYLTERFNTQRFKNVSFAYTFLNLFKEQMR